MTMEKTALTLSLIALAGGSSGGQESPGKSVYEYAVEYAGYTGPKEELDTLFNKLLTNTYLNQEDMESYVETYVESYVTEAFSDLVLDGGSATW